jgi:Mg-chelatase subunit ChlD
MTTKETNRDKWVSASLIVGAILAGVAALAAQRGGAASAPSAPAPLATPAPAQPSAPASLATPAPAEAPAPAPLATPVPTRAPAPTAQAPRPRVDLVFALDTTGSMSGLIEGAKTKIWSIASFVARAQPTPDVRVGLVAYRDIGDAYVTRVYDLDDDLDRVYQRLLSFRADGGGDGPEHVARALHEAVHKMSWAPPTNNSVRLIYLVGDAPPHLDYQDGYDYATSARSAASKGIQIHAIRCGSDPETATYWRRIASLAHGEFLTIDQDGGMRERRTPYDDELARLHDKLSDTVVAYGAKGGATRAALAAAALAPVAVKAARAGFLSAKKESDKTIVDDLIGGVASGRVDLAKVPAADLPASLAALPADERRQKVAATAHERGALLDRIATISSKRDDYMRKSPDAKPTGFDGEVEKTLRKAGSAAGLAF